MFYISVDILGANVVSTPFSQDCKTHEASFLLIGVLAGEACLSEGHLEQTEQKTALMLGLSFRPS